MAQIAQENLVVHILHSEPVIALGLAAALAQQPGLEVRTRDGSCRTWDAGVLLADYATAVQLALDPNRAPCAGVIVVSVHHREQEVRRALEAGVQGYVLLGCSTAEMVEAVRVVGRGSKYLCLQVAQRMADSLTRESLTSRELDVLALLSAGCSNKVIARDLDIAVGTVKAHVKGIMAKLAASSRTQAVTVAVERGLVPVERHSVARSANRSGFPSWTAPPSAP